MASTNKTTNYELSQYVGSDKPTYLGDYNSDMLKIDTQMKTNADNITTVTATANTASTNASTAITNAGTAQTTAETAQSTANGAQTTATSALNKANQNETDITAINTLINGVTVYQDSTGTTQDVSLSQNITSFKRMRISGYQVYTNHNFYFAQDLDIVINERTGLLIKSNDGDVNSYIACELLTIGSTQITRGSQLLLRLPNPNRENTSIYITKVTVFNY